MAESTTFVRQQLIAPLKPPPSSVGTPAWLRQKLFGSVLNATATLLIALILAALIWPTIRFMFIDAVWDGSSRVDCLEETLKRPVGACWPFITARFHQFMYGFYPADQVWRVNLTYAIGLALMVPLMIPRVPFKGINAVLFFGVFPVVAFFLLVGDVFGLPHVETRLWGGFLVSLVITFTGIVCSLPLGILLALARRSSFPLIRWSSIVFIEFWRGVPLITVLFFAVYMLPYFLPERWKVVGFAFVLIGVAIFSAAYMAEVVRGGLQAIPRGQYEAAQAVGLGYWRMMIFIILPQALRIVIPGIVNSFISLFKDTALVQIVAIFDL